VLFYSFEEIGFAAPNRKLGSCLIIFLFFLFDQKERKNQESPNVASRQSLAATRPFILFQREFLLF
jgi:hypothetical protein